MVNKQKEHPGYDELVEALKGLSPSNLSIDCLPYKVNEYLSEENTDIEINHVSKRSEYSVQCYCIRVSLNFKCLIPILCPNEIDNLNGDKQ